MENPEILETLVTQDTVTNVCSIVSLDWPFLIIARFFLMFIYYLLYVLCLVKPIFPVSLGCPFLIVGCFVLCLFTIYCKRKSRTDNPEKLEKLITPDTEQAIGSK
jgi:hypothetical protein